MIEEVKPLKSQVLLLPIEQPEARPSGLILMTKGQKRPQLGTIISIGPEVKDVKVGQQVMFGRYSTTDLKVGGKTYYIIKEEEILAITEGVTDVQI